MRHWKTKGISQARLSQRTQSNYRPSQTSSKCTRILWTVEKHAHAIDCWVWFYNWLDKTNNSSGGLLVLKKPKHNRIINTVQRHKWSPTANDPQTENDPQIGPQMMPNRKWSPMQEIAEWHGVLFPGFFFNFYIYLFSSTNWWIRWS